MLAGCLVECEYMRSDVTAADAEEDKACASSGPHCLLLSVLHLQTRASAGFGAVLCRQGTATQRASMGAWKQHKERRYKWKQHAGNTDRSDDAVILMVGQGNGYQVYLLLAGPSDEISSSMH
jgi:hypothetical protein